MASVWIDNECTGCGEPIVRDRDDSPVDAVLIAAVRVTHKGNYQTYSRNRGDGEIKVVRPNFYQGSKRQIWHESCLEKRLIETVK